MFIFATTLVRDLVVAYVDCGILLWCILKYISSALDPEQYDLPVLKQPLHFYRDPTKIPEILPKLNKKIQEADAYLIISAEYNRSIPPALTNILDHFPPAR